MASTVFRREKPVVRCALLVVTATGWFTDLLFACPKLNLCSIPETELGLKETLNPYHLAFIENPEVILICMNWYAWLERQGEAVIERVFAKLRSMGKVLVGLEGYDMFRLRMPPAALDRFDVVLKAQGIYRDRELYNYEVGSYYPGANWTQKLRNAKHHYRPAHLDKLRLSLPCFVGADTRVRARVRTVKAGISSAQRIIRLLGDWWTQGETAILRRFMGKPKATVHCSCYLSHIQRLELLVALKQMGVSGLLGVSDVPEYIFGTDHFEEPIPAAELEQIRTTIHTYGLSRPRMSRSRFKRTMLDHQVVIAPTGYGEITFRHAEAWEQARALICQDLSHVETMYSFRNHGNVLYCKPDFSDIKELLGAVESGTIDAERIGQQGRREWRTWIGDLDGVFERGVVRHLQALR